MTTTMQPQPTNSSLPKHPRIGAHVSAAGGIDKAVERAAAIGCNTLQIFSGSPRFWKRTPLTQQPLEALHAAQQLHRIDRIFTHALYLINLASDKPEILSKSIDSLQQELTFDAAIKGSGVIVHLGSHQGRGWDSVRHELADSLRSILQHTPAESILLIENSAGQQGKLCSDLSEIRWLMDSVDSSRLRWCLDTCHAHAAGYRITNKPLESYQVDDAQAKNPDRGLLIDAIVANELLDTLSVIHVNDSKDAFRSGRDRHENIGDGTIGNLALTDFLRHPELAEIPLITEVPGLDGNGPDAENIHRLTQIIFPDQS